MSDTAERKHFTAEMPVAEAMSLHPRVAEVFSAFHLGGCAHCAVNQYETVEQVCCAYGVDIDMLLEVLEGLLEQDPQPTGSNSENL